LIHALIRQEIEKALHGRLRRIALQPFLWNGQIVYWNVSAGQIDFVVARHAIELDADDKPEADRA
jgi:hypothetical protein